jgi:methylmalonyl-CoA carboxyltransferase 1.3S subunit
VKLRITVDNRTYEVEVEAAEPDLPKAPRGYRVESAPLKVPAAPAPAPDAAAPEHHDEAKLCRSPVSGIVVRIAAQPGQIIQTGDVLMVLEAMKMETNITAPVDGKVQRVAVNAGDGVQAGQTLVEFE